MNLTHRRATLEDLLKHEELISKAYSPDSFRRNELEMFWRVLYRDRLVISILVEEIRPFVENRPVAFSAYVFVNDDFLDCISNGSSWLSGELCKNPESIFDRNQIAKDNLEGGLNICVLHHVYPQHPHGELPKSEIQHLMPQLLLRYTRGYQIKSYTKEAFGPAYRDWLIASGLKVRAETSDDSYIMGITRQESEALVGTLSSSMFVFTPPIFGFSDSMQETLIHALGGQTDEEIAECMNLSVSAIKKRWHTTYERINEKIPGFFGAYREGESAFRGPERRRHLLSYLQNHSEETNFVPSELKPS